MGNIRIQEVLRNILNIANGTTEPSLRLTKIAMAAEAGLDELRAEQRRKDDEALFQVKEPRRTEDGDITFA